MALFGIGDTNRILVDVPVRYAPILGLPYDPDDDSVFEKSDKKINIKVPKGQGKAAAELHAARELMKYGIPFQAAKSLVGKDYELLEDSSDPRYQEWQLEASSPQDIAAGRGREKMPTGIDVATGVEYGDAAPIYDPNFQRRFDKSFTPFEEQSVTGERVAENQASDPFNLSKSANTIAGAIAAMEKIQERQASAEVQAEAERKAAEELERRMEREAETRAAQAEADRLARQKAQLQAQEAAREAELRARSEAIQNDPTFAAEEGLGGERMIDPLTGQERESAVGGQVTDRGVIGTQAQTLAEVLESQREADRAALAGLGEFTPFDIEQDNTAMGGGMGMGGGTGIKEMLNIFNQDPERYYTTETIIGPDGQAITQQVLSPVAQAALQAFSTQRGAEAMETGARFGAGSPFGVIAGMGGETAAADAKGLAEQQAYSGITSPFAALQTGSDIDQISQILRGGLSAQQQSDLAGLQARGGLGVEDQFALAGMQARGGLTPQQMQALAGLQARGGLTPEQRYAEQRLAMMPSLLQMSPQSLGGLSHFLGGPEALQGYLSPFFTQPEFAAQGAAPAVDWRAQQALPRPMTAPATGTPMEPFQDPTEWGTGGVPVSTGGGVPISASRGGGVPISATAGGNVPIAAGGMQPTVQQTMGGYKQQTPWERGVTEAKAAVAGKELEDYLGEVTPFGGVTRRGGFGSSVSDRFTY